MKSKLEHVLNVRQWTLMRLLRLSIGTAILYQAWVEHNLWMAGLGGLFFLQGLFNTGCAGNSCNL